MKGSIISLLGVLIFVTFSKSGQYFYDELSVGLYLLTFFCTVQIYKKVHWSVALAFFWAIVNGIYFSLKFPSPFIKYGFAGENLFKYQSAQAVLILFLVSFAIINIKEKYFSYLVKSLPWICLTSSFLIIYNTLIQGNHSLGGVMENSSMDPTLISPLFPTIFYLTPKPLRDSKFFKILGIASVFLAIILSKGSVGVGAMAIAIFFLLGMTKELLKIKLIVIVTSIVGLFIFCNFYFNGSLFEDSHRFWIYKAAWQWWTDPLNFVNSFTGTGLGTYWGYGPMTQAIYWRNKVFPGGVPVPLFTWMHSDWLQIGFELGIIGLLLSLNCAYHIIKNCLKCNRYWLIASIVSYMGSMIFNMPLHWFISLFCGAIILRLGFTNDEEYKSICL